MGSGRSGYEIGGSGTVGSHDNGYREVQGYVLRIHEGRQGKHMPSHSNYEPDKGRSIFRGSMRYAQELIEKFAGAGEWYSPNKEVVEFGENIGTWISADGKERLPTTRGTIHYSLDGAHIVPANPGRKG